MPRLLALASLGLAVTVLGLGCNSTSFEGGNGGASQSKQTPKEEPKDDDGDANPSEDLGGSQEPETSDLGKPVAPDEPDCLSKAAPLRLVVVLDVSASMTPSLDLIKQHVARVAASLKEIKPAGSKKPLQDVAVGLVTYVEGPQSRKVIPLTTDIGAFSAALNQAQIIVDPNNTDFPEEGLPAVAQGLRMLTEAGSAQKTIVPVLLVISDTFAHNGHISADKLNYGTSEIDGLIGAKQLRYLQLYDAVPTTASNTGLFGSDFPTPGGTPAQQWDAVRATWKTKNPKSKRSGGRSFGFPFTSDALLQVFPTEVAKVLKICT